LWTIESSVVRSTARAASALALDTYPQLETIVEPHWRTPPANRLRDATQLTNRIIRRLDLAKWRT
jgi:hypothetical protein